MWGSFDYYLWKQRRVHSSVIIWSVEGTSQNCTKLCPIKTRPTLSIKNKLSPIITQLETLHFLTRALFLWREESANMILCTRCVTMETTGVSISLSHSFSLSLALSLSLTSCHLLAFTTFLPGVGRSVPNPAAGQRWTRAAPLQSRAMKFGNKCHSGAKQLLSSRQAKPILSFWIMIMQNSVTRITGDESLSLSPPIERVETPSYVIISFQRLSDKNVSGSTKNTRWGGNENREGKKRKDGMINQHLWHGLFCNLSPLLTAYVSDRRPTSPVSAQALPVYSSRWCSYQS